MNKKRSIHKRKDYIKHIGEQMKLRQLNENDNNFVSDALINIGGGADPAEALDIKPRRGESSGEKARLNEELRELAILTIHEAKKGKSVEDIVALYGENGLNIFNRTEETIRTWSQEKKFPKPN